MPSDSTTATRSGKISKRKSDKQMKFLLETSRKELLPILINHSNSKFEITLDKLKEVMNDPNLNMIEKDFLSYAIRSTIKGDGEFVKFILLILYGKDFQNQAIEGDYKVIEKEHANKTDQELLKETIEIGELLKQIEYEKINP